MNDTTTCKSCGHIFEGRYCNACGERVISDRDKALRPLVAELIKALTFADGKLWRTVGAIAAAPGRFSRDFADGRRKPYMRPLSIFLLANLVYFLFPLMSTFHSNLATQLKGGNFVHGPLAKDLVERRLEERGMPFAQYEAEYDRKTKELSKLLLVVLVVLLSFPLWVIHGTGRHYYSEAVVLSLELMTFLVLFAAQALGLLAWSIHRLGFGAAVVTEASITVVAVLLLSYALLRSERTFFATRGWRALANPLLGLVGFVVALYVYRALLFFVTFWWL